MSKKLVILDLDNTCICAKEKDEIEDVAYPEFYSGENQYVDLFEDENDPKSNILYRIYPRPGLQAFLDQLFNQYQVAVWTAADIDYALFVIKHFITCGKPERQLKFIMWHDHCEFSSNHTEDEQAKQLTLLSLPLDKPLYDIDDMVIIDDNELVLRQIYDSIDSQYFDVGKKYATRDTFLPHTCLDKIKSHFNNKKRLEQKRILLERIHYLR
jgi:hypothetical protein